VRTNFWNWMLVIVGVVAVIGELLLGAITGFDLALIGTCMAAGGAVGLWFESTKIGLISTGVFAFIYLAFFRRWLRHKMTPKEVPSNADALIGRTGVVTVRIAPHEAGQIKLGDEIWRAELASAAGTALEPGQTVTVSSVEGVTLKVK
jgi:membrane protein implicated in regulation of membrane protease activity